MSRAKQKDARVLCPGCRVVPGGMVKVRGTETWHMDCWAIYLEGTLKDLLGYYVSGTPDAFEVLEMRRVIEDALRTP